MEVFHVVLLTEQNRMLLAQTFKTEVDALNYIHGADRRNPVDAYIILTGRAVRK